MALPPNHVLQLQHESSPDEDSILQEVSPPLPDDSPSTEDDSFMRGLIEEIDDRLDQLGMIEAQGIQNQERLVIGTMEVIPSLFLSHFFE